MKNKIISIFITLVFLFTSIISVNAIAPTPRVELDNYDLNVTDINNVFVSGTVSVCKGQLIGVYDSSGIILYNYKELPNTNTSGSFKLQIPARFISSGTTTFKVKSLPANGIINGSNPKTVTVKVNNSKKDQTITASNISLKVKETKNLNAKVSSNLPLTYVAENSSIATIDVNGKVIGRKVGTTKVIISQAGNSTYNPTNKSITVTVTDTNTTTSDTINGIDYYQFNDVNKTYKLNCKSSSGKISYKSSNSKIVSVDSNGKMTSKKPGIATITASAGGKSKKITVIVPEIRGRVAALAPWRNTLVDTYSYIYDRKYSFGKPGKYWTTNGKWNGKTGKTGYTQSCLTLPNVSLKRVGILGKNSSNIWFSNGNMGSKPNSTVKKLKRTSKYVTVTYPHKSLKSLSNSGGVKYGDIVCRSGHTFVFMGTSKGSKKIYNGGTTRSIGNGAHVSWGHSSGGKAKAKTAKVKKQIANTKATLKKYKNTPSHFTGMNASGSNWNSSIHIVVSINTFTIKTTCVNGTITGSNLYMAGQTIPISYKAKNGKKLKSIKVDGKSVNITTFKNSYKFTKLDKNHTIEVIYE